MQRRSTLFLVAAFGLLPACSDGGPSSPGGGPFDGTLTLAWDGRTVDWGAPESLRATVTGAPPGAVVVWRSLDDLHLSQPVVLGRGSVITTAPLKPGATTVEARLVLGELELARTTTSVQVEYRERWNVTLEAQVPYPDGSVGDVWVSNDYALVARRGAGGISIVDLRGGAREVGRFTRPGLFTQDVAANGNLAFISHEGMNYPNSVTIVDLSDPSAPREVAAISREETPTAHTVWVDEDVLYVAAPSGTRAIHVYDIADPARPRPIGMVSSTNGSAHDMHARDGVLYGAYLPLRQGDIGELVIASTPALARFSATTWSGAFTHSTWLSEDGRTLYVADEIVNAPIRIYDVSSPGMPTLVATYQPRLGTIPHHFLVRGSVAYLSHYKHGVEVLDLSNPRAPRLIGFYDTMAGIQADQGTGTPINPLPSRLTPAHDGGKGQGVFQGAWGVHWSSDGRIVVSDMSRGLFVLRSGS